MKDKVVVYKQPSSVENLRQAIKEVWVTEITHDYCKSLVSSMPHHIHAAINSKGHTKYWKVVRPTLLDVIKF